MTYDKSAMTCHDAVMSDADDNEAETWARWHKFKARLQAAVDADGRSPRAISLAATGQPDAIRNIMAKDAVPSVLRLAKIAAEVKQSMFYLQGIQDDPVPRSDEVVRAEGIDEAWRAGHARHNISICSARVVSAAKIEVVGGAIASVAATEVFRDDVVDEVPRPLTISPRRAVYGFSLADDGMSPAFEPGDLILLDDSRAPSIRDFVAVTLHSDVNRPGSGHVVLIARFEGQVDGAVLLRRLNPTISLNIALEKIAGIDRVLKMADVIFHRG